MEKKVMIRLCAKIVADTDLYETDKEVQNLIDWVCLSEQIKENNIICNLTGKYKLIKPDCREGAWRLSCPIFMVVCEGSAGTCNEDGKTIALNATLQFARNDNTDRTSRCIIELGAS